jgi:hypothetical protein
MGTNGVPLNCVVREHEVAQVGVTLTNYEEECYALAPLTGDCFEADARRVHQIIKTYTQGESAEEWIQILSRFQEGCKDILTLKAHFQGEGNASRRIAEANNMRESLHYTRVSVLSNSRRFWTSYSQCSRSTRRKARSSLRRPKLGPYLIKSNTGTSKLRSMPFIWTNMLTEQASLGQLLSLLVKYLVSLRPKISICPGAIRRNTKYRAVEAAVEVEATTMADVVMAPIMEEEVAVEEEVVADEAAEEAAVQLETPVGMMTGMV